MKLTNTKSIGAHALKVLAFGASGAGKTSLAKTIGEPTIIISAESGLLSLHGADIDALDITLDDKGHPATPQGRLTNLMKAYEMLTTPEFQKKYRWVVLDSISEVGKLIQEVMKERYPDAKNTMQLWGEYGTKLESVVKKFRDLPGYNVLMTCLDSTDKDENNRRIIGVQLNGRMSDEIYGFFDEVFYLTVDKEGHRSLQTAATDQIRCKDRSGKLSKTEEANIAAIAAKIRGTETQKEKK